MKTDRTHLKLPSRLLLVCIILLLALQLTLPFRGWVILLVGLGGVWLIAFIWARALARGLRLVREMRFGWAQVGDQLEERFTLRNTSWLPALWVEIADHSTLPDYNVSRVTGVDGDGENSWIVHGVCNRRGVFTLGPTTIRAGDPFGIYTVMLDDPASVNMMVMPPIVLLPSIEVASGGRAGEGRRRAHTFERTVNAAGVREYQPGDSWSSIHWRVSAHHDSLHVRLFDNTPTSDWWILLDLDANVQVGAGQDSTMEHGIILAASLADRGLRLGRSVGLVAHGDPSAGSGLTWLVPQGGAARRWEILRALALANAGAQPLGELIAHIHPSFKNSASLIVITPNMSGDWIPSLLPLMWRGVVPTVLLLDPVSFGGAGDVKRATASLTEMEIAHYVITRDVLNRSEMRPGHTGAWEFDVTPLGRARAKLKSRDTRWKALA